MVALPEINSYSSSDLERAKKLSPALQRYLHLLKTKPLSFADELRLLRHDQWSRAAIVTLLEANEAKTICYAWSKATEDILERAWRHHQLESADVALFGLGKLGARELNLSSDIDIILSSQSTVDEKTLKATRSWINTLSQVTPLGFCYRVDINIRPGGSSGPLISSFDFFTNHYGYHGETWERMAMIRLSGLLGLRTTIEPIKDFCRKFSFRKHLDYNLFFDLTEIRAKLREHHGTDNQLNIKYCPGGIRELELFIHALQLIHGSKHKGLLTSSTTEAIQALTQSQLVNSADGEALLEAYWFFRKVENRLHCIDDQHTYEVALNKWDNKNVLEQFKERSHYVSRLVDDFLKPYRPQQKVILSTDLDKDFAALNRTSPATQDAWEKLVSTEVRSKENQRDEGERKKFLKTALDVIQENPIDPDLAIMNLSLFVNKTKAKSSFYALFNKHKDLIAEVMWIFSCSPYLSQILIHRPELIDSYLMKFVEINPNDEESFHTSLRDYKLLSDLIASSTFLRNRDLKDLTSNLSRTTETITSHLLDFLSVQLKTEPVQILTLGKWAGLEMGLKSDLDFIFISADSHNPQQLRLARRFINVLQNPIDHVSLYQIDLRLRPSGNAGPLLISAEDLTKYLNTKSMAWERQAYLRSRFLGSAHLNLMYEPKPISEDDRLELCEIQKKLLVPISDVLDLKKCFGGLIHCEFVTQIEVMKLGVQPLGPSMADFFKQLQHRHNSQVLTQIEDIYLQMRTWQQMLILLADAPIAHFDGTHSSFLKLAKILQQDPHELFTHMRAQLELQRNLLNAL